MAQKQSADMRANVEFLRMMLCDARSVPELREMLLAGGRSNIARLAGYFQAQIEAGTVRGELSAEALATGFDSLFSSSILFEYVFQDSLFSQLSLDALLGPLVDVFVRGSER